MTTPTESVRELIAVPQRIEAALLLDAEQNPEDALGIERVLQVKRRVAKSSSGSRQTGIATDSASW